MNPLKLFRRQRSPGSHPQTHMTFASIEEADAWWGRHERGAKGSPATETSTTRVGLDRTIDSKRSS